MDFSTVLCCLTLIAHSTNSMSMKSRGEMNQSSVSARSAVREQLLATATYAMPQPLFTTFGAPPSEDGLHLTSPPQRCGILWVYRIVIYSYWRGQFSMQVVVIIATEYEFIKQQMRVLVRPLSSPENIELITVLC